MVHQEKIYKNHKEIKVPKILLSKPEFNVDFKSVLIFATLFILFEILAFECTKVSQNNIEDCHLGFFCLSSLPESDIFCSSCVAKFSIKEQIYKSSMSIPEWIKDLIMPIITSRRTPMAYYNTRPALMP